MTQEQFKNNLLKTISEIVNDFENKTLVFTIKPVKETNVSYNSTDDFVLKWVLTEKNISGRCFDTDEVVALLSFPNHRYPLWIKVYLSETSQEKLIFELNISMRFRTPAQLKHIDTGHPPFIKG